MELNLGGKRVVSEIMRELKAQPLVDTRTIIERAKNWIESFGKPNLHQILREAKREAGRGDIASKEIVRTLAAVLTGGAVPPADLLGLAWYLKELDK